MAAQDPQEVKLLFALFDVDNSGTLTGDELKQLLQSTDPDGPRLTEEQLADYLKSADIDGSGDVSLEEFVTFMNTEVTPGAYSLKSIFKTIDTNGDGSVEKSEFEQAKTNNKDLNPGLIKILEETFQANANDKVTYEQFVESVKKQYQS